MKKARNILLSLILIIASTVYGQEKTLRINEIQVIGSHNSYKKAIEKPLLQILQEGDSTAFLGLEYNHFEIKDQLDLGLRNLELDIYADTAGNRYASPRGLSMAPGEPYDPEGLMSAPGFKVLHIPDIDFRSSCLTFENCLRQLKEWSDDNPAHTPVFITLETKDQDIEKLDIYPEKFNAPLFQKLDSLIFAVLSPEKVLIPDLVRGNYESLEDAILKGNWPQLKDAQGKFLFILDDTKEKRNIYTKDYPSLRGRVLFVNADPGTPEAATLIRNNPYDETIPELVKKGYIIRTRADANTIEARSNNYSRFEAACKSGAQIITTDYYDISSFFKSSYKIFFEGNSYFRTNPITE